MEITTYHDHDLGSFFHAGAMALIHHELNPIAEGADVVMQSRKGKSNCVFQIGETLTAFDVSRSALKNFTHAIWRQD